MEAGLMDILLHCRIYDLNISEVCTVGLTTAHLWGNPCTTWTGVELSEKGETRGKCCLADAVIS